VKLTEKNGITMVVQVGAPVSTKVYASRASLAAHGCSVLVLAPRDTGILPAFRHFNISKLTDMEEMRT